MSLPLRLFLGLVAFSLAGSLLTHLTSLNPGPIAPITSLLTIACGVFATFSDYVRNIPRAWARIAAALLLGAGFELVGLATGLPFGHYEYTNRWWPTVVLPSLGHFPLLLPFAWLLMAGAACLSVPTFAPLPRAVCGGLLAAVVDLAMEPVMAGPLGYWRWIDKGPLPGGAPTANFFGWWAVATLGGLALSLRTHPIRTPAPRWVLAGFVILIAGLGLIR